MWKNSKYIDKLDNIIDLYYNKNVSCQDIGIQTGISGPTIGKILKMNGHVLRPKMIDRRKYQFLENYFDIIDTKNKAYILGLLYADGSNDEKQGVIQLRLQYNDVDILHKISKELRSNVPIRYNIYKQWKNTWELNLCSKYFSHALAQLGMVQNKSLILQFPTDLLEEYYSDFIRGYFDGDGCLYIRGRSVCKITFIGTLQMMTKIQNILSEKCDLNKTKIYHCDNVYTFDYGGIYQIKRIFDYLYNEPQMFLDRKYFKFLNCLESRLDVL